MGLCIEDGWSGSEDTHLARNFLRPPQKPAAVSLQTGLQRPSKPSQDYRTTVDDVLSTSVHRPASARHNSQVPDRSPRRDYLGSLDDPVHVDAKVAVEVLNRSGLAEMLHAQRARAVPHHAPQPS